MKIQLLSEIVATEGVILLFAGITLISFILTKDVRRREDFMRLTGSLLVAFMAVSSRNGWVYAVGVFIVGLLVGTERFMSFLVAAFRGSDAFLTSGNLPIVLEKMSGKEVERKQLDEAAEAAQEDECEDDDGDSSSATGPSGGGSGIEQSEDVGPSRDDRTKKDVRHKSTRDYLKLIRGIERAVIGEFKGRSGEKIQTHTKVGKSFFDASIINNKKRQITFIEVKFLSKNVFVRGERFTTRIPLRHHFSRTIDSQLFNLTREISESGKGQNYRYRVLVVVVVELDEIPVEIQHQIESLNEHYNFGDSQLKVKFRLRRLSELNLDEVEN